MPKKTRRGGRYTTGVRRDGSQTYGRRPICGVIVIYGPGLLLAAGALAHWKGWA
jgi:hypothetical protein